MENIIINWISEENSWLKFAVENQLLGNQSDPSAATDDYKIKAVISRIKDSNVGILALKTGKVKYTSTGNAFWDLFFLADIGLKAEYIQIQDEVNILFELQNNDGTFVLQDGTKPGYFCIPTIILTSLVKMGYADDPHILRFINKIFENQRLDGGWHCAMSRATGRKLQDSESCPMDNLNVLMLLGQYDQYRNDTRLNGAIDLLLMHWKRRMEPWRPYGFGIGSDFLKLKYPAVKYGILRMLDVLSLYPYAIKSPEFNEMLTFVMNKSIDGKFFAESVSRSYSEFDFGQTKIPSRWITFLIYRLQKRTYDFQAK
ncbi:MAG TPA: hypothetical protein DCG38_04825 [Eubacteriaceae bacterium]|nr:hypothetical protein [Eubacteriaceae bacterium]